MRPYDLLCFPPAGFTAGHSAGLGGKPETTLEQLERAHSTILAVAKSHVHYAVLQGIDEKAAGLIATRGYTCEWFSLPGIPDLLLVTWKPRN